VVVDADVYRNYKAGAQDKKGATAEDTAATDERHSEVEIQLTWQSQEEVLLTCSVVYC